MVGRLVLRRRWDGAKQIEGTETDETEAMRSLSGSNPADGCCSMWPMTCTCTGQRLQRAPVPSIVNHQFQNNTELRSI
jgi:hypothetical protein